MCTCHPPITHLRHLQVAACGKWSARLTNDPGLVNCPDCRREWPFAFATGKD